MKRIVKGIFLLSIANLSLSPLNASLLFPEAGERDMLLELTGVSEDVFRRYSKDEKLSFYNRHIKQHAGIFYHTPVGTLRRLTGSHAPLQQRGEFKVIKSSIQEILANDDNHESAIQMASNFTALEGGMAGNKQKLNGMQGDRAKQGETAAACTILSEFYIKYIWPIDNRGKTINLMYNVGFKLDYRKPNWFYIETFPNTMRDHRGRDYDQTQIGYQRNVTVSYSAHPNPGLRTYQTQKKQFPHLVRNNTGMKVDKIKSFSFSLKQNTVLTRADRDQEVVKAVVKTVLDKNYEGAVLATWLNGREKLFLTLVGAGAFRNDQQWVYDAINKTLPLIKHTNIKTYLVVPRGMDDQEFTYWQGLERDYQNIGGSRRAAQPGRQTRRPQPPLARVSMPTPPARRGVLPPRGAPRQPKERNAIIEFIVFCVQFGWELGKKAINFFFPAQEAAEETSQ